MPGGLLNLVAYGNQNIMLTGNPSKTFFKCTYAKYTNFGLQKFRIDFDGQRSLRMTQPSTLRFKMPRYGDLLMDTYLVMTMPTIWSTLLPPRQCPTVTSYDYGNTDSTNGGNIGQPLIDQDYKSVWSPYEFKWIKNLGTQMIKEVRFLVGGQMIQKFTGDYLYALVERDFNNSKKDLYYKMTGNVPELNDPANAFGRKDSYPNAWPTNTPSYKTSGPEPSIRSRKLYVPLNIWFTMASKMAFPLVSLQYNELHIEIDIRPVQELFVIRDVESTGKRIDPSTGVPQGNYIQPNFNNSLHQFYRFLQPPPVDQNGTDYEDIKDIWRNDYYIDQRTNWAADIHLISTYAFLSDDEVKVFALKPQNYLVKEVYHRVYKNVVGTQKVTLDTTGMVSNWMWYLQRTDAPLRNEWSNFTNWPYDHLPNNVVDPLDFPDIPDKSTPEIAGEYYNVINVSFVDPLLDEHNSLKTIFEGDYRLDADGVLEGRTVYNGANNLQLQATLLGSRENWNFFNKISTEVVSLSPDETGGYQEMILEDGTKYRLTIGKFKGAYIPPNPIGRGVNLECICLNNISKCPSLSESGAPITMVPGMLTPAYNPWTDLTETNTGGGSGPKPSSGCPNCTSCSDTLFCDKCNDGGLEYTCADSETNCPKCRVVTPAKSLSDSNPVISPTLDDGSVVSQSNPCYAVDFNGWEQIYTTSTTIPGNDPFGGGGKIRCTPPKPQLLDQDGSGNTTKQVIFPNLPYYKTNYKITGNFQTGNQKDIMLTWALLMDGKYRENDLDAGVLNYVEKYVRTSGNAPDGLYCYNFGLHSSPFDFQPSGAINLSKFRTIEFEISTYSPPSDPNAETLTICDSDGNIVGINKPVWRIYDYTYDLVVMEERYNVLKFISGNAALAYAR